MGIGLQSLQCVLPAAGFVVAGLLGAGAARADAEALPELTVPHTVAVNTGIDSLQLDEQDFKSLAAAGITHVRVDIRWHVVTTPGGLDFGPYIQLRDSLKEFGVTPIFLLAYNTPEVEQSQPKGVYGDSEVASFTCYAAEAVKALDNGRVIFEVGNEQDTEHFWPIRAEDIPNPINASNPGANNTPNARLREQYMILMNSVVPAMRNAVPGNDPTIISGGILNLGWKAVGQEWLMRAFDLGLLDLVDGVGTHFYGGKHSIEVERITDEVGWLRGQLARHGHPDMPVLGTEFGERWNSDFYAGSPEERQIAQAETYARLQLVTLMLGLHMNTIYEWQRPNGDGKGHELLDADGIERPAYHAIATLTAQLRGGTFERRVETQSSNDYVLVFTQGGRSKLVLWTSDQPHELSIAVDTTLGELRPVGMLGEEMPRVKVKDGYVTLRVSGSPQYLELSARR